MATSQSTLLEVTSRQSSGSRSVRRLRRAGMVPGVLYGGGDQPVAFEVGARILRQALAARGAVLDLSIDGAPATPAVLKDTQRDAIRGQTVHVDLVRVRLDRPIHAIVALELTGAEDSPGVKDGGVLEQIAHELNVEALPNSIPESISHDVSTMEINDTLTLAALTAPDGVKLLDEDDLTIAILSAPRVQSDAEPELEGETERVGGPGAAGSKDASRDA